MKTFFWGKKSTIFHVCQQKLRSFFSVHKFSISNSGKTQVYPPCKAMGWGEAIGKRKFIFFHHFLKSERQ